MIFLALFLIGVVVRPERPLVLSHIVAGEERQNDDSQPQKCAGRCLLAHLAAEQLRALLLLGGQTFTCFLFLGELLLDALGFEGGLLVSQVLVPDLLLA